MKNNFDLRKFLIENKLTSTSKLVNENQNRQAYLEIGDLLDSDAEWDRDELLDSITMIIDKYFD